MAQTKCSRKEKSLASLTKKFIALLNKSEDGILNLKDAIHSLAIGNRRIYDITTILQGIGAIEKVGVNSVQWRNSQKPELLKQQIEELKNDEQTLILHKAVIEEDIQNTFACSDTKRYLYVTNEDVAKCFGSDTAIVLRTVNDSPQLELDVNDLQDQGSFQLKVKSLKAPLVATTIVLSDCGENKEEEFLENDETTTSDTLDTQPNLSEGHTVANGVDCINSSNILIFDEPTENCGKLEIVEKMQCNSELLETAEQINLSDNGSEIVPTAATSSDIHQQNTQSNDDTVVAFNNMMDVSSTDVKKRPVHSASLDPLLQKKQNKRAKARMASRTSRNRKKVHMEQMEKHIQELLSKNQSLVARCTDLNNLNISLHKENSELHDKMQKTATDPLGDCNQTSEESTTVVAKQSKVSTSILSTQALADLWDEISVIPLPECSCEKLRKTVVKKRVAHKRKL